MAERVLALINPAILLWAREQRGIPREIAADKIGVTAEKLAACEQGSEQLSFAQLRKAADFYKRSVAVFYLQQVPQPTRAPLPDFRRLPESAESQFSSELLLEMRRIREKQEAASSLADYGPHFDWAFLGTVKLDDDELRLWQLLRAPGPRLLTLSTMETQAKLRPGINACTVSV